MSAVVVVEKDITSRGMYIQGSEQVLIDAAARNVFLAHALK